MPQVKIPLKDATGKIDPAVVPRLPTVPYSDSAGAPGRIPVSTAQGWEYVADSEIGGAGGGGAIGATNYSPSSPTSKTASTAGLSDLDVSLLTVSFTAPTSGKVQVDLSATVKGSTAATRSFWGLRSGTTDVAGSLVMVHEGTTPARAAATIFVTGLTPGQNYIYKWAAAASTGTTTLTVGGATADDASAGPATMVVRDAPFG